MHHIFVRLFCQSFFLLTFSFFRNQQITFIKKLDKSSIYKKQDFRFPRMHRRSQGERGGNCPPLNLRLSNKHSMLPSVKSILVKIFEKSSCIPPLWFYFSALPLETILATALHGWIIENRWYLSFFFCKTWCYIFNKILINAM